MTSAQYDELFLELEKRHPELVEGLAWRGRPLWQHLRLAWRDHHRAASRSGQDAPRGEPAASVGAFSYALPDGFGRLLSRLPRKSVFIHTQAALHTQRSLGKAYDPYLDPAFAACRDLGLDVFKIRLDEAPLDSRYPAIGLPLSLAACEIVPLGELFADSAYKRYRALFRSRGLPAIDAGTLMGWFFAVEASRMLWEEILALARPRLVILECYYSSMNMGLAHACRNLGIPCADYQHGLQAWPHLAYAFPGLPRTGWETVPEWFFTWGTRPARNLERAFSGQTFHKTAVAGNPMWLAWKKGELASDPALLGQFERRIAGRVPVCVALPLFQAQDRVALLREAVAASPPEWLWLLRRHPLYPSPEADALAGLEDRVESELSTRLNLHDVLERSRHFVTGHSSSLHEAVSLHGLRATLITPGGKAYFRTEILNHNAAYAETARELFESVARGVAGWPWQTAAPYITPDTSLLAGAIRQAAGPL